MMKKSAKRVLWAGAAAVLLMMAGCASRVDEYGNYRFTGEGLEPGSPLCRARNSVEDAAFYDYIAARPESELTVEDAVHLALEHNIDLWVAQQRIAIQEEKVDRAMLKMLPSLVLGGSRTTRSKESVSSSTDYYTGATSLPSSYSRERQGKTFNAEVAWGLLDFGLSYVYSLQEKNQQQIDEQIYRRTRQKLVLDVTGAYWRALAADEVAKVANSVGVMIESQRDTLARQIEAGNISKEDGLNQDLKLLNELKVINRYERDTQIARADLARLIGIPIGMNFELKAFDFLNVDLESEPVPEVELARSYALLNRPELFSKDLEEAISHEAALAALLKTLPSPSMMFRYDYDADSHLLFSDWTTYGLRASWNLLSIPGSLKERKIGKMTAAVNRRERMAMSIGVLTQVNISYLQYGEAIRAFRMSNEIFMKRMALLDAMVSRSEQGTRSDAEVVDQKLLYLQDRAAYLMAFAEVAAARSRIYNTMGLDPDQEGNYSTEELETPETLLSAHDYSTVSIQWAQDSADENEVDENTAL
jgi:outer membrane protein TolC